MNVSKQSLIKIIERSSNISERLSSSFIFNDRQINANQNNAKLEKWYQFIAKGNQHNFEKRLLWDGLDTNTISCVLG